MLSKRRKVYQVVTYRKTDGPAGDVYEILLDGRSVKTPGGNILHVATQELAEAVTAEWNAQEKWIVPATMPLTQLANTAIDRVEGQREALIAEALAYVDTDLVCYRASGPSDLVARQEECWQPLLDWLAEHHGIAMPVTFDLVAPPQACEVREKLAACLRALDTTGLTVAQCALGVGGSLVLALALEAGRIDGEQLFALSQLEETWQIERWGEDEEAADRRAALRYDALMAEKYLSLARC